MTIPSKKISAAAKKYLNRLLSNEDIDFLCANVPGYVGAFPDKQAAEVLRELKRRYVKKYSMVINLQSGPPGSHWVLLMVSGPRSVRYVDPLGYAPEDIIVHALGVPRSKIKWNDTKLQLSQAGSHFCGHFCVSIVHEPTLLRRFGLDQLENERLMIPVFDGIVRKVLNGKKGKSPRV